MAESQTTHPIYELKVDVSNASRLYEYYMLKSYIKLTDSVLDIGCNTGTGMDILLDFSDKVYGIDVVPELNDILSDKYKNSKKAFFKIVKEGEIPFEDNFFDVIVANNFIEHVEFPDYYLDQFKKMLKPNGKLFITTVNREHRLYFWQKPYNPHHYTEYSPNTLSSILNKHFSKVEDFGIIKKEPFFPNYVELAREKKYRMGIKYPVLSFLKKIKYTFIKRRVQVQQVQSNEEISIAPIEKFDLKEFDNAFSHIKISNKNPEQWIELFSICYK